MRSKNFATELISEFAKAVIYCVAGIAFITIKMKMNVETVSNVIKSDVILFIAFLLVIVIIVNLVSIQLYKWLK